MYFDPLAAFFSQLFPHLPAGQLQKMQNLSLHLQQHDITCTHDDDV